MKKVITPMLKFTIDKVKRNKFIQNVFESPFELEKFNTPFFFVPNLQNSFV